MAVSSRRRGPIERLTFAAAVTVIVVVSLFPFLWIVRTSLQSEQEFSEGVTGLLPQHPTLDSYAANVSEGDFLRPVLNSTLICLATTAVTVVLVTFAAYALSRLAVPGRGAILGQSQFQVFHNRIDAAIVIISVPIVALVLLAQRKIVSGLTAGALK